MRARIVASLLILALGAAACAPEPGVAPVPAAASRAPGRTPALTPTAPALLLEIAIAQLRLDPSRRARLERLEGRLEAAMAGVRAARADLLDTIADGLEAGRLDAHAIAASLARVESSMRGAGPALAATLDELHAMLTPEERARVVALARDRWREWHARWVVLDDESTGDALGGADDRVRRALAETFPGDAFDANAIGLDSEAAEDARESAERTAAAATARIERLAPSERIEQAIRLRERAAALR